MANEAFPKRIVERSFRKFNDLTLDLIGAAFQAWEALLNNLLDFCETDPVMKVVTEPLLNNPNVDVNKWHAEFERTIGSMAGSGHYSIPKDDEDRTSLYYQVLRSFSNGSINVGRFAMTAYGTTSYQDMVDTINREFVNKFAREVKYRIREVEMDVQGHNEVAHEALVVFHQYHGPVQHFGNIQDSQLSIGDVMSRSSKQNHDQSVNVGNLSNSNLAAHSTNTDQSVSIGGEARDVVEQILTVLRTHPSLSDDDRQDAIGDAESLKLQLGKKKKDVGTIEKIIDTLGKIGPIATLAVKLHELLPSL